MALEVIHDGEPEHEVAENCCLCRAATRYWHSTDVALCRGCASTAELTDLPNKADWCARERSLRRRAWELEPEVGSDGAAPRGRSSGSVGSAGIA